jgi:hypothetical protein
METPANTGCHRTIAWWIDERILVWEGLAAYQLVGGVTAYQGIDG